MAGTNVLDALGGFVFNIAQGTGKTIRTVQMMDRPSIRVENVTDGTSIEVTYGEVWDWREGRLLGMDAVPCRVMGLADPVWWLEGLAAAMVEPSNVDRSDTGRGEGRGLAGRARS